MVIRGYTITARLMAMIVGVIVLIIAVGLFVKSCDNRKSRAAQARLDAEQAQAASNSAADAIGTVARSGEAAVASEQLTRENEREIRAAAGAEVRVGAGVNAAGRKALCKRAAYKDDPKCKGVTP